MSLSVKVNYPRPDIKASIEAIHAEMSALVVEACKTFVFATTDVIPVLTGGTKASFIKLASEVRVALEITPKRQSRIPIGIETSTGEIIAKKGKSYGFVWESHLYYIDFVHTLVVPFVEYGIRAVESREIGLPPPVIKAYTEERNG